jgi:hypothetical protein
MLTEAQVFAKSKRHLACMRTARGHADHKQRMHDHERAGMNG